jgi:glycosyltransferase involved in cell wall biosynthesis
VRVVSEPDSGFYDALAKGLKRASGDYVAYLNAGDLLQPAGLAIAAECFELPGVDWLTGYAAVCNEQSQVTQCWLPYRYRRNLFACGAYGTFMPFLQQESTLWRRRLHAAVDFRTLQSLRLAGDSYLWKCFASMCDLHIVRGLIGSFRVHRGQISERMDEYRRELMSFSRRPNVWDRLQGLADRAIWAAPERIKALANRTTLIGHDHARQAWTISLIPKK